MSLADTTATAPTPHPDESTSGIKPLPVGALVLAAGFSRRFGGSKLLAPLPGASVTVFEQSLRRLADTLEHIVVVTRPELFDALTILCDKVRNEHANLSLSLLSFDGAEQGMGASLAFAAQHIGHWRACLVCLADMPHLSCSSIEAIADELSSDNIVIPQYDGQRGHPTGFGSDFFTQLAASTGDRGARALLTTHADCVIALDLTDRGILLDIDTPQDLDLEP